MYIAMKMEDEIWKGIAKMHTPGFFITAEMQRIGSEMPYGLEAFILQKLGQIESGAKARRFVFQEGEWRIYITFFPTDRVVDERYALKNKVLFRGYK